jgi:GNAT superfamily N-acetyltransferase
MTTATLDVQPDVPTRFRVLPSGVRFVRLGPGDDGWLVEYQKILRIAAADFLKRGKIAGTADGVVQNLSESLAVPTRGVWLVLTPQYQLLGFALTELASLFGGPVRAIVLAMYLYPRRTPRGVFADLRQTIIDWARDVGATEVGWLTRRRTPHVWQTIGQPSATFYLLDLASMDKEPHDGR